MKKKNLLKKSAVIALSAAFLLSGASCTLFSTDSDADMAQVVAEVDIAKHKDFKAGGKYEGYASVVEKANGTILKRDLISYFLNVGSSYAQSYGYKQTFEMLMKNLINRKVMVQYSMAYYLEQGGEYSVEKHNAYVSAQENAIADETEKKLTLENPELLTIKYFLTENGTKNDEYDKAVYSLKKAINDTLDSAEENYIKETSEEESETFGDSRTTPTGVGTEQEDFYDKDYEIYTGHNTVDSCGESYERLDGSTQLTRRKAYNDFLSNLSANNLLNEDESTTDFTKVGYYYQELAAQLEQSLINKFSEELSESAYGELTESYVEGKYSELLQSQEALYGADSSAFVTALSSVADDSFVVYCPSAESFGFVYNILIPFSATDSQILETYTDTSIEGQKQLYKKRAELLENVKAKDLRGAWISNSDDANYAYDGAEGTYYTSAYNSGTKLFFEDNFTNTDRYEEIKNYLGKYPYNGTIRYEDGKIVSVKANSMNIDGFIKEMEGYIDYALGASATSGRKSSKYVDKNGTYTTNNGNFDYSQFLYYEGKVSLTSSFDNYFYKDSDAYKAASAVNELMFAYSTDTGCFNSYLGYEVSPVTDKYVKEFAYAAQVAIKGGSGTYVVCSTEYGWHILYTTVAYKQGAIYDGFVWADKDKEGTFSNLWFEALKDATSDVRTEKIQSDVLGTYNNDSSVKKYVSRYQDLLDLDE